MTEIAKREGQERPRRNIMRAFKIDEISAVDHPAQQGATIAIMKRRGEPGYDPKNPDPDKRGRDDSRDVEKRAMLTGVTDDHAHLVILDPETGEGAKPAGNTMPAQSPGADFAHTHPWIMRDDGEIVIGMAAGHMHDAGEISTTRMRANELLMEKQERTAETGGRRRRRRDEMTDDAKKAAETHKAEKQELEKKLAAAEAYGKLSDAEKAYHSKLDSDAKATFLEKSDDERLALVKSAAKAAADQNPIVYTAADGSEYRKNDDARLIALAKQSDERLAKLEKAQKDATDAILRKRAETELPYLPGTVETHMTLLKQVDSITDDKAREEALRALKAHNTQMGKNFSVVGTSQVDQTILDGVDTKQAAEAELEKRAKALQKADGKLSYLDAYAKASEANPELYEKAVIG